jgi:hypothetical protein
MYIVEDLHASYWKDYGGGLHNPFSAMAFLKRLADIVNQEHWRTNRSRTSLLTEFAAKFGVKFNEMDLAGIHSVEFVNSLCIIRKSRPEQNLLGKLLSVGSEPNITDAWDFAGKSVQDFPANVADDGDLDPFSLMQANQVLSRELNEIHSRRSWKMLMGLRAIRIKLIPPGSRREHLWWALWPLD